VTSFEQPSAGVNAAEASDPAGLGGPLAGVKVVDLTRALAGPYCTAILGDFGADVVKVEGTPGGDVTRNWPPFDGDRSLYYLSTNRNKRSLALDLRSREGQAILSELVRGADVLVENFRPGTLAKLGLDPDELRRRQPDLVVASLSAYGEIGPMRDHVGLDQVAQGMSGLMSVTGAGANTPMRLGVPIADMVAGLYVAVGIVASLAGRNAGRPTIRINTSLLETAVSLLTFQAQRFLTLGEVPGAQGNDHPLISPYGTFGTADGSINVAVGNDAQWHLLCRLLGAPELADSSEFRHPAGRTANRAALSAELNRLFSARTSFDWLSVLGDAGVPCGPIHTVDQVFADPQVQALGMVRQFEGERGSDRILRGPVWMDGAPPEVSRPAPSLGEHTREILAELGLSEARVEALLTAGAVVQASAGR
jgi:crotonobetainyl-CoA:carnitine CoA-transferase CaiB-like acyl-CoA transferase